MGKLQIMGDGNILHATDVLVCLGAVRTFGPNGFEHGFFESSPPPALRSIIV